MAKDMSRELQLAVASRRKRNAGVSMVELLIVIVVILTLAALSLPHLLRARAVAREAAAVSALRTLATMQVAYASTYQRGYAPSLLALGPPPRGTMPNASAADMIDALLAAGERSGYTFVYAPVDHNGDGAPDTYIINANPTATGVHSLKYFYLDTTMIVRAAMGAPADTASEPVPAFSTP